MKRTWSTMLTAVTLLAGLTLHGLVPMPAQDGEAGEFIRIEKAKLELLLDEVERVHAENNRLRRQAAEANLENAKLRRELEELQQFMADRREYGDDFARYQQVKEITLREDRRRQAEEARRERERQQEERRQGQTQRDEQRAGEERLAAYRRAGFHAVGFDVFLGKMGYAYHAAGSSGVGIDYEPGIGLFYQPVNAPRQIDFSRMKLSGAVVNASDEVRNIGVAIAFFDAQGNQVGSETVRIQNARPNVPYPFNAVIDMAATGPFVSSSQWVLYADPIAPAEE